MRRILITTGILGGGTALTFAAAVLAATMFPNGTLITTYGGSSAPWEKMNGGAITVDGPVKALPAVEPGVQWVDPTSPDAPVPER
jgi:hypothetical protein